MGSTYFQRDQLPALQNVLKVVAGVAAIFIVVPILGVGLLIAVGLSGGGQGQDWEELFLGLLRCFLSTWWWLAVLTLAVSITGIATCELALPARHPMAKVRPVPGGEPPTIEAPPRTLAALRRSRQLR